MSTALHLNGTKIHAMKFSILNFLKATADLCGRCKIGFGTLLLNNNNKSVALQF
jgi:hypothetical protein